MPPQVTQAERFRIALAAVGLNRAEFALLTGTGRSTVFAWGDNAPQWAWLLLEAWRAAPAVLERARKATESRKAV